MLDHLVFLLEDALDLAHVKADGPAYPGAGDLVPVHPGPDGITAHAKINRQVFHINKSFFHVTLSFPLKHPQSHRRHFL